MPSSPDPLTVRSYGGAMTVTGSCHVLEAEGARVMVDCGLFQGSRALVALNRLEIGVEPASVDAVVLTHAHLDHAGRLPLLVARGFAGEIHALPATRMLAELLLLDAAKIAREDAQRARRKGRDAREPLFDEDDVAETLDRFRPLRYGDRSTVAGMAVTPYRAGHIPGSASFLMEAAGRRLVASGDLGNAGKDVLPDPDPCPEADLVLIESTYGDRGHRDHDTTVDELAQVISRAAEGPGKVLVPSFALERTQDLLYTLARLEDEGRIPVLPIYVDSPLADRVEDVYQACRDEFSDEVAAVYAAGRDAFAPRNLRYTHSVEESKAINAEMGPAVVIAGSGMMTGGRILHHLRAHLGERTTTLLIVGYQPTGGLGRRLVDREPEVRVMSSTIEVKARVATIGGLSAHAGRGDLLAWAASAGPGAELRCVHGEAGALNALREGLEAQGQRALVQPAELELPNLGPGVETGE